MPRSSAPGAGLISSCCEARAPTESECLKRGGRAGQLGHCLGQPARVGRIADIGGHDRRVGAHLVELDEVGRICLFNNASFRPAINTSPQRVVIFMSVVG
jgi:hypothetical protein